MDLFFFNLGTYPKELIKFPFSCPLKILDRDVLHFFVMIFLKSKKFKYVTIGKY